jgi:ubiquitin carboxyl-terminal hydrolase 5/13
MGEEATPTPSNDASSSSTPPAELPGSKEVPARYVLKAFISHKGPSVHSGHYVAHIKTNVGGEERWVLFNDEKVVKADEESVKELKKGAYLYIFVKA